MSTICFQFLWTPYRQNEISRLIVVVTPPVSREKSTYDLVRNVEFQQADRVMWQFGFTQNIPFDPVNLIQVHRDDLRGINDRDWAAYHH